MHSSRMRTARISSCLLGGGGGVCLSTCWDTPPPRVLAWRPPLGQTPQLTPWVWAWRPTWPDPSTPRCIGLETPLVRPLNFPPGCEPGDPMARPSTSPWVYWPGDPPPARPLNFPPGCGPGDPLARPLNFPPRCGPKAPMARPSTSPWVYWPGDPPSRQTPQLPP